MCVCVCVCPLFIFSFVLCQFRKKYTTVILVFASGHISLFCTLLEFSKFFTVNKLLVWKMAREKPRR